MNVTYIGNPLTEELEPIECWVCGCAFALSKLLLTNKRKRNEALYCPNGHSLGFGKSEADKLREELAAEKARRAMAEELRIRAQEAAKRAKRSAEATRGAMTRLKKRAAGGVCPCCKRTFSQLARHMQTKHPDFSRDE